LKRYKSPGCDEIPAELIQAGGEILRSKIHKVINPIWNEEKLHDQWNKSTIVPVHKNGDKTDCSNYRGISLLSTLHKILSNIFLSKLNPYILYIKLLGIISLGFDVTDQLLITSLHSSDTCCSVWVRNSVSDIKGGTQAEIFQNRMLRRIFVPKRDEATGGWRKLHNEELHNLYL
jgi:hypothetical protein